MADLAPRPPQSVADPAPSGIVGLGTRYRELGRLRMGERVDTGREKNGKPVQRPTKLETWRFTSTDWRLIQKAAELYGGEPSRWDDAPGTVRQYQVTSEANDVPVMLPPEVALSQAMEAWKAAECLRRCDGQWEQISGAECLCQDEDSPACKPTTRLSVLLTDMPGLGVWRLESHGWYAARELVPMVRMAATFGAGTRFRLRIDPRQRQTKDASGKTVTYLFGVPVLDTDLTPGQLLAEVAAPAPVDEIVRQIKERHQESGAGLSAPSVVTGDGATGSPAPDPMSDPPPVAPPRAGGSDPTSPPAPRPGKAGPGGDTTSGGDLVEDPRRMVDPPPDPTFIEPAGEGDAIQPDDETVGPADRGEPDTGTARDGTTGAGPTPKSKTRPGDVIRWVQANKLLPSRVLVHLKREHPDDFGDLKSVVDLGALGGEQADRAIAYLKAAYEQAGKP